MRIGILRGYFYYEYYGFIKRLLSGFQADLIEGPENNEDILFTGNINAVDEACLPIKLVAGQTATMMTDCDYVILPRIEKDFSGRWLCPKLIGLPELLMFGLDRSKVLTTEPIDFSNKKTTKKEFRNVCSCLGMDKDTFRTNFENAYEYQSKISLGIRKMHVEADWEFSPSLSEGEIILPNTNKVLLLGHSYNVYDKFSNSNIIQRLDELGIDVYTEKTISKYDKEKAIQEISFMKKPFWETLIRLVGTALCMSEMVDGIIYLSSFSCGMDPFIIENIKKHINNVPLLVLKLDEHKGMAGLDTRLEAFADLLERRRVS